jgi:methylmalonyl-CoA mutase
MAAVFGGT